jgi:hypothetical protein
MVQGASVTLVVCLEDGKTLPSNCIKDGSRPSASGLTGTSYSASVVLVCIKEGKSPAGSVLLFYAASPR